MRATISSIHSQVIKTVAGLVKEVDFVISLDSHLDVAIGGDDDIYPAELQMIARRTGAHTAMRSLLDKAASKKGELVVAIPQRMLARHAEDIESSLPRDLRARTSDESISSVTDFLEGTRGIGVFESPPKSLLRLVPRTKRDTWMLDIDIDYMLEMQEECYTRIIRPGPDVLQSSANVLDFVTATMPENITISEAKVRAIRDPKSNFSLFIKRLEGLGYKIEEGDIAATDAEVVKGISVCNEFYRLVSKNLMKAHMGEMMMGNFDGFRRAQEEAAREFFPRKGYALPGQP